MVDYHRSRLSTLRKLCINFNFSQPVNEHPYNKYIKFIKGNSIKNCEQSISVDAKHFCALKYGGIDDDIIVDVPVSVDGSWQKRYGHNSMISMVFVMSIDTGHVKSLYCFQCKKNPNDSACWKEKLKVA